MSEKRIVVPEGMLRAFADAWDWGMKELPISPSRSDIDALLLRQGHARMKAIEAALRWLSEHPIVPTDEQINECHSAMYAAGGNLGSIELQRMFATEWQRRMFLAREPDFRCGSCGGPLPEAAPALSSLQCGQRFFAGDDIWEVRTIGNGSAAMVKIESKEQL